MLNKFDSTNRPTLLLGRIIVQKINSEKFVTQLISRVLFRKVL